MRQRPLALIVSALLFSWFPATLIFRHFDGFDVPWFEWLMLGALPIALIVGLVHVSRVGWYTLIALISLLGVRDLYEYYAANSASPVPLIVHLLIYSASLSYFINPRIRRLYFDPKMRWWRTKPRTETHQPAICFDGDGWSYPVLRDLSIGGCFLESPQPLPVGTRVEVMIPFQVPASVAVLRARGEVRWSSPNPLRRGFGVEFGTLAGKELKALRQYLRTL